MNSGKALAFIKHWLKASTKHDVHSPFVFDFVTNVLPGKPSQAGSQIEALRRTCLKDSSSIEIEDFGAGYSGKSKPLIVKTLAQVTRSSARGRKEGELLSRIVQWLQPQTILEMGTNLGFSAAYIAAAMEPQAQFITLEGSSALVERAQGHLTELGLQADIRQGEFDQALQALDWPNFRPDFVLLDGNHRYEATLHYFDFLLDKCAHQACLVFDDIHWSEGMERAWAEIVARPEVNVSIDLFELGLVFIGRTQAKQHFRFRFRSW